MRLADPTQPAGPTAALEAHGVYLSDADEAEILRRVGEAGDPAEFALRTCLCGARIDGFDAYVEHLYEALSATD
jgi:hypothetical protein